MKQRVLAMVLVISLLCGMFVMPASAAEACFTDIPKDAWFYSSVRTAYEEGLMVGTSDTTFSPYYIVTRGMFVTVLGRLAGITVSDYSTDTGFVDVDPNMYYAPYITWAVANGITYGIGDNVFWPEQPVTREQMACFIVRYLNNSGKTLPDSPDAVTGYADADTISPYAVLPVEQLRPSGLFRGDDLGNLNPLATATRAEAAAVFVRLADGLYDGAYPKVNTWVDYEETPEPEPEPEPDPTPVLPEVANPIVSNEKLIEAAKTYELDYESNAFQALVTINTKYASSLTATQKASTLVFLFEGCGFSAETNMRMNAMCVVVKSGEITYLCPYCSTIPDYPFNPAKNEGTAMPTLQSGIYAFSTVNHYSTIDGTYYAALNVNSAKVVRFTNRTNYYASTSSGINIHRRKLTYLDSSLINSAGCQVIGRVDASATGDYARFIQAVGIVPPGSDATALYSYQKRGIVVIDRAFAADYLRAIGYPDGAISLLG